MASASHSRWILVLVLVAVVAGVWWMRRQPPKPSVAYVADRTATLWNTTAQVRQQVATLGYGEKVAVLRRSGDQAEVRTDDGAHGWIDARLLMDPVLWQQATDMLARARTLPVQATGYTRTISNLHLEPGRDTPRIFQFGHNVPVVVLERRVMPAPASAAASTEGPPGEDAASPDGTKDADKPKNEPKNEDWLFVSRAGFVKPGQMTGTASATGVTDVGQDIPIAGWVLGRFIQLDPPQPIPDYSSSAGMRVVAWVVLNTVADPSGDKPQYLVAGARGAEGQPCDFTLLRVYTWGATKQQYETAYVEDNLCGNLPIRVSDSLDGPEFRFAETSTDGLAERVYRMKETIVRRVNEGQPAPNKRRR